MDKDLIFNRRHVVTLIGLVVGLVLVGVTGYMVIEGWSFLEALYMVVITLATVGYKEIHPLSTAGTIFTILLIVFGVVTLYYVIRVMGEYVLASRFDANYQAKKMQAKISNLLNHYVVCGYGRVGSKIVDELLREKAEVLVVEKDPVSVEECRARGVLCLAGDATCEDILLSAGIMNAKGLVSVLGRDSDNILVTITARTLNSNLFIVAKSNQDTAIDKMLRVGANRVVSPYQISAFRMATFALHPGVADFVDNVLDLQNSEIQITDMVVNSASRVVGQPLETYLSNRKSGVTILVINRQDGRSVINPVGDTIIQAGDRLILMGIRKNLEAIEKIIN
ncbi:TPA: potassium channel protein [Patescibacteria group bacterium]|nr:potassium channel protein [Patescibacteria group bacterium]